MDLATIIGIVIGTLLLVGAIATGQSPMIFLDLPSLLIVGGGTLGATLIRNPLRAVVGTFGVVRKAFTTRLPSPGDLADEVVALSRKARKESLLALEKVPIDDPFLSKAVGLCIDGLEPGQIRAVLESKLMAMTARHKRGQQILESMGAAAPAFGMIGTLIGLVQMLSTFDDPSSIGPAMAVALLTTLYGAVIANMFALPLAEKLRVRSEEEALNMQVCLEGVLGIVQGEHPASIDEKLRAFIAPKKQASRERERAAA